MAEIWKLPFFKMFIKFPFLKIFLNEFSHRTRGGQSSIKETDAFEN